MPFGTLAPVLGTQPMFPNSLSPAGSSRPGTWSTPDPSDLSRFSAAADPVGPLGPTDGRLLDLLGEHEVLTTSQLVRLTGLPERTIQHRLGRLDRAGLLNRLRPQVPMGTARYHCWLTAFGARAIGAAPPEPWRQDPTGLRAVAALSELWLGVRHRGPEAGLRLESWRRLPSGVPWLDPRTGTVRELPVEAELQVSVDGELITALVLARDEQILPARLVALLGRFAGYVATLPAAGSPPVLLVLARTERLASTVRSACGQVPGSQVARHLESASLPTASGHVAVGVIEPRPTELVAAAVWHTPAGYAEYLLAEVLSAIPAGR
ncbi:MAG: replication-relaxation family protein [Acidimicrobiales bacterium]